MAIYTYYLVWKYIEMKWSVLLILVKGYINVYMPIISLYILNKKIICTVNVHIHEIRI